METNTQAAARARDFFDDYRDALLARDIDRIAAAYHCPALIAFPAQVVAVTAPAQTRTFFENAVGQYAGVTRARGDVTVLAATEHSIWADVTWDYDGAAPAERMVYQLLDTGDEWLIGVLTPVLGAS
ncbi:hypothetical protein P0W64_12310 [Tsukamurella sp. 8F]|uniref:hypothetical protein n=1 Tax=unclassified Tsukamurella TaxID=2633480 RepID=UPI0023B89E24|nr:MULTISPECIES: hypothetical protein [unclassified Tsukamurella]MDF0531595.1 hypothetical protein [Tsukamurella sp. 8J]MDF0587558.1 hypothetical protein [Tsukamurella sp. 8F]